MKKTIKCFVMLLLLLALWGTTSQATVYEPTDEEIAGTASDEVIYIIGEHIFTEETDYISSKMLMYAARTIEMPGLLEGEEALEYMKVYTRDLEGNWIETLSGDTIEFEDDFTFNIKHIDLGAIKTEIVSTEKALIDALNSEYVDTIVVNGDISTTSSIYVPRDIVIEGTGTITSDSDEPALIVPTNVTVTIANDSTVTIEDWDNNGTIIVGTPAARMRNISVATLIVEGTVTNVGKIINNGIITLGVNGELLDTTELTNQGIIEKYVATAASLKSAIANEIISKVIVNENIALTETINVTRDVTIELNGKTLNGENVVAVAELNNKRYMFNVTAGKFVINGEGALTTKKTAEYRNIKNEGATVEINGVDLVGYYNVDTNTYTSEKAATTIINESTLEAEFACATGWNNGTVNINNSDLESKYYAITGNGKVCNAVFNVENSALKSKEDVVVYMPSTETLNITNSTLEGYTGIEAVAGKISIVNSSVTATGEYNEYTTPKSGDGSWVDGSAIFVRSSKGYDQGGELTLTIDDKTTLTSTNGNGIRIYENPNNTDTEYGVEKIKVEYYSKNITSGADKIKEEYKDPSSVTVTLTDLS